MCPRATIVTIRWWSAPSDVRANTLAICECVDVYSYMMPNSDTRLAGSKVCRNAPRPPNAVPSYGLDENTGTISHGEGASFVSLCCAAGGSDVGDCADTGAHQAIATSRTTTRPSVIGSREIAAIV